MGPVGGVGGKRAALSTRGLLTEAVLSFLGFHLLDEAFGVAIALVILVFGKQIRIEEVILHCSLQIELKKL